MKRLTVLPLVVLFVALGLVPSQGRDAQVPGERAVFLAGRELSDDDLTAFSANLAASGHPGALLLDSPASRRYTKLFLDSYRTEQVVPVGTFADRGKLKQQLGATVAAPGAWDEAPTAALWKALFPRASAVVVCPAEPRRDLLQAACLAGALQAPLWVLRGEEGEADALRKQAAAWQAARVYAVGKAIDACQGMPNVSVHRLGGEKEVSDLYVAELRRRGAVETLVVANPADRRDGRRGMSALAPWVALQRRAALLLTAKDGRDAGALVKAALRRPELAGAENLILVADLEAVPMEKRPNPLPGVDEEIMLEPPGPDPAQPFSLATGRLFHRDPAVVPLMLARQRLLAEARGPRKALLVANPGGGLPLLETISRHTGRELANAGYQTTAMFREKAEQEKLKKLLPEQDLFVWEGHHSTLVANWNVPGWEDPMRPSLVVLQSCLALTETEAGPFLKRGAVGVIGATSRTFSASGGAFSLAYVDALVYDDQSVGGALRQAKNFLIAYAKLKEKRLPNSKLGGANVRSAWSFSLWGDPTVRLPRPETPAKALAPVHAEVRNNTIVVQLPGQTYDRVATDKYEGRMWPNGRLGGLLTKGEDEERKNLVPMLFAEVRLPKAVAGRTPRLKSRVPDDHWVFLWDARRQAGSLLIRPRTKDREEVRFQVTWEQ